ncbi:hypothetical protein WICPIJ_002876, partial [Wickerhamomyces pijperi]
GSNVGVGVTSGTVIVATVICSIGISITVVCIIVRLMVIAGSVESIRLNVDSSCSDSDSDDYADDEYYYYRSVVVRLALVGHMFDSAVDCTVHVEEAQVYRRLWLCRHCSRS